MGTWLEIWRLNQNCFHAVDWSIGFSRTILIGSECYIFRKSSEPIRIVRETPIDQSTARKQFWLSRQISSQVPMAIMHALCWLCVERRFVCAYCTGITCLQSCPHIQWPNYSAHSIPQLRCSPLPVLPGGDGVVPARANGQGGTDYHGHIQVSDRGPPRGYPQN